MTKNIITKENHTLYENTRYDTPAKKIELIAGTEVYYKCNKTASGTYHTISKTIDGIEYTKSKKEVNTKQHSNMGTQLFFRSLIEVCRTSRCGCLVAVSKETCHFTDILTDSNTCKQNQELHYLGYDY